MLAYDKVVNYATKMNFIIKQELETKTRTGIKKIVMVFDSMKISTKIV